jgi:hypothetical protein
MATPLETYNNSQERQNGLKWQNATIQDVAKKYGFDFSKGYANKQAEAVAQAQRNSINNSTRQNQAMYGQNMKQINGDLKAGVVGTENNFFQTYLQQRQQQSNRGINAGMQADQNVRLGMNQQSVLADIYRDTANNKSKESDRYSNEAMRLQDALALVEQQKITEAEKMYQELLTRGYGMLGTERSWYNTLDQQAYGKYRDAQADAEAAAARAAAQRAAKAAQQQAAQQQSRLNDLYNNYNQAKGGGTTNLTPIQQYTNAFNMTPAARAVSKITTPSSSYTNRYLFNDSLMSVKNNPSIKYAQTPASNTSMTAYEKMRMLFGE